MIQTSNPQSTPPSLTLCPTAWDTRSRLLYGKKYYYFSFEKLYSCWTNPLFWSFSRPELIPREVGGAGQFSLDNSHNLNDLRNEIFCSDATHLYNRLLPSHLQYGLHQKFCWSCGIEWISEALKCFSRFWCSIAIWLFRWIALSESSGQIILILNVYWGEIFTTHPQILKLKYEFKDIKELHYMYMHTQRRHATGEAWTLIKFLLRYKVWSKSFAKL